MSRNIVLNSDCARVLSELEHTVELSPQSMDHTQGCAQCAQELSLRRRLRDRLKAAARNIETPPFLEARIRANLQQTRPQMVWQMRWAAIAAMIVVCLAGTVAYQTGHLPWISGAEDSYIASVSSHVAKLMRVGLGDHIHCAVFRKYPKAAQAAEALTHDLGAQYAGLVPALAKQLPPGFQVVMAHQCRYEGRRFVHLTAKSDRGLISLILTRKQGRESFGTEGLVPALTHSGIPFYATGAERFQITAFETGTHLAYLVSDLSGEQNAGMMTAMASEISNVLDRLSG